MVATIAVAIIGVVTAVVNGVSSNGVAEKNKESVTEAQKTLRQESSDNLTAGLFANSSSNTSNGWSELLNINDVPQSTVLSVVAVLFVFVILKTNK